VEFDELSNRVIGCAIEVHRHLGPGLLESTYRQCFAHELSRSQIHFEMEKSIPVEYKGIQLDCGYRIDLLCEERLVIELKAVEKVEGIHVAQLLTYMKQANVPIGLLINFNVEVLKNGLPRLELR